MNLRRCFTCLAFALYAHGERGTATAPLPQDAYVWQRSWNESVVETVTNHGTAFSNLVVLRAEIAWHGAKPEVVPVRFNYAALATTHRPVGIALRIGGYAGPFAAEDPVTALLSQLATTFIAEARSNGITASEFQIDFDCAASKLDGYRVWVETLRKKIAPMPLTITVLPSWLKEPAFKTLAEATDGYVLQVHSLERPKNIDAPFTLCDPAAAQRAVEQAAKVGVPFRVALPTYGYLLAFDKSGGFVGLSAEEYRANPGRRRCERGKCGPTRWKWRDSLQTWSTNGPSTLRGIIWYRLPTIVDNFNWHWPTLGAIVASRFPRESFRGEARQIETGLVEINLVNDGELDLPHGSSWKSAGPASAGPG